MRKSNHRVSPQVNICVKKIPTNSEQDSGPRKHPTNSAHKVLQNSRDRACNPIPPVWITLAWIKMCLVDELHQKQTVEEKK